MRNSITGSREYRRHQPSAIVHRFAVGEQVRLNNGIFGKGDVYHVTGILPARDNSPQYRIRNDEERHERVTTENLLDPAGATAGQTLMERTFGNG